MRKIRFFIIIGLVVLLDYISKALSIKYLKNNEGIDIIKNVFRLEYLENKGAAWGIFSNGTLVLGIMSFILSIILIYALIKIKDEKKYFILQFSLSLVIGGAIGNMWERFLNGYVVDMLYFNLINFPIFNVADICVTIGMMIILFSIIFVYKEEKFF